MKKTWIGILLAGLCWVSASAAADSLKEWSQNIDKPEVQQKILSRIFSAQVGSVSASVPSSQPGSPLFPMGGSWVRLGQDVVYVSSTSTGGPYLVVTCMLYNEKDQSPATAASYIFYDTAQRATAISGGYATHEQVQVATLPGLNRSFVILVSASGKGPAQQTSASVLAFEGTSRPRSVWNSPISARAFQFGFSLLSGKEENLVFRSTKDGETQYSAFSWSGSRFELNTFAFESRLKALPDSVWQYGG